MLTLCIYELHSQIYYIGFRVIHPAGDLLLLISVHPFMMMYQKHNDGIMLGLKIILLMLSKEGVRQKNYLKRIYGGMGLHG